MIGQPKFKIKDLNRMVMCKHVVESDIFPPDSQALKELFAQPLEEDYFLLWQA